jgi:arylsulfatase A-like enzyme
MLTADHGGAQNSEFLRDLNIPAGNLTEAMFVKGLDSLISAEFGKDSLILGVENYQIFLNLPAMARRGVDPAAFKTKLRASLTGMPGIAYVADLQNMDATAIPEPIRQMIINGYHQARSGDLQVILLPGWYSGYALTGTSHGTWHPYDAHIPLLWFGWGIAPGSTLRTVYQHDIASTLAALLHIQPPNGNIGKPIPEAIRPAKPAKK